MGKENDLSIITESLGLTAEGIALSIKGEVLVLGVTLLRGTANSFLPPDQHGNINIFIDSVRNNFDLETRNFTNRVARSNKKLREASRK